MRPLPGVIKQNDGAMRLGSLRSQLLRWLLGPLLVLVCMNAVSVYFNAIDAADMAYDRSLLASTRALAERVTIKDGKVVADVPYVALDSFETDIAGKIFYKVSGLEGELVSGYGDLPPVPANVPRSEAYPALVRFYHADYNGEPVRIAALLQPVYDDTMRGIALIQVGETLNARQALSRKILNETLTWQACFLLATGALVWFAVKLVLRPLMRLKNEVETRDLADLSGVDQALVHKEVRPLVAAMNNTMARLQNLIASQRRFIADASHQLRTPLTILKTQAQLALRETDVAAMRDIVGSIAMTTDSAIHLANRLLTLARIEHGSEAAAMEPVSLTEIVREVGVEFALTAVHKEIDLSLDAPDSKAIMHGHVLMLHELVSNLLDNAIRYTPVAGRIVMRVDVLGGLQGTLFEIIDSGIGVPKTEQDKIFTPFYRAPAALETNPMGTGLGLTIVREIVALHRATITLSDGDGGCGLRVSILFPHQEPGLEQSSKDSGTKI